MWQLLYEMVETLGDLLRISWMPSHLDSIDKRDKRTIFTLTGVCDERHIAGNVEADRLAALGAAAHNVPEDILDGAKDRAAVAFIVQRRLVSSWEHWHISDRGGTRLGADLDDGQGDTDLCFGLGVVRCGADLHTASIRIGPRWIRPAR